MRPLHSLSQQLPQILSARSFAYFFKSTSDKEITEIDGNSVFSPHHKYFSSHGYTSGNMADGLQFDYRLTREITVKVLTVTGKRCRVFVKQSNNLVLFSSVQELSIQYYYILSFPSINVQRFLHDHATTFNPRYIFVISMKKEIGRN